MRISRQILGLAAASVFGATAQLQAQAIQFSGGTAGCFYYTVVCTPVTTTPFFDYVDASGAISTTAPGSGAYLAFQGGLFNATTNSGSGTRSINGSFGNFGNITTSGFPFPASFPTQLAGLHLLLAFYFAPNCTACPGFLWPQHPDVGSGNTPNTVATVTGTIDFSNNSGIDFDFGPGPQISNIPFTAGGPGPAGPYNQTGTFSINVVEVPVNAGVDNNITGIIHVQSIAPEPATLALFATGLVGMIPLARRRKSASKSA
jgi:hypothetical protein